MEAVFVKLRQRSCAIRWNQCRSFAAPGSNQNPKAVGKQKDSAEERKFLDAMQQLAFASDKASKYEI
jgi:hypothetical protein